MCVWVFHYYHFQPCSQINLSYSLNLDALSKRARKTKRPNASTEVPEKQDNTQLSTASLYSTTDIHIHRNIHIQLFYHNGCDIILMSDEERIGERRWIEEKRERKSIKSAKVLIFRDKIEWIYIYWVLLKASHSHSFVCFFCCCLFYMFQRHQSEICIYIDMICTVWRPTNFARCHVARFSFFFSFSPNKTLECMYIATQYENLGHVMYKTLSLLKNELWIFMVWYTHRFYIIEIWLSKKKKLYLNKKPLIRRESIERCILPFVP